MAILFEYSIMDNLKAVFTITEEHIATFVVDIHYLITERPEKITIWLDTDACVSSSALQKMAEGLSRVMTLRDFEKKLIEFKRPHDYTIPQEINQYLEGFKTLMVGTNTTPFIKAEEASKQTERHREVAYQRHQHQIASQIKEAIAAGKFHTSYTLYDGPTCEIIVEELKNNGYNVDVLTQHDNNFIRIDWNVL